MELSTKKLLTNKKIQLQIQGKDSGFLTVTTDSKGEFTLDDKLKGQKIMVSLDGMLGAIVTATDGATLNIDMEVPTMEKNKETWK